MRKEAGEKNDSSDSSNSSEEKRLSRKNDADMSNTKAAPSSTANDNSPNKDTVSEEHNKQHSQNGGDPTPLQAVSTQNVASIQIPLPNEANGRMFETPWTKTAVFGSKRGGKQSRWQRKPPSNKSNEHQIAWKQAPAQEAPLYSHHRPPLPPHHYVALPRMTPGVTFMNYPSYRTFIPLPPGHHYSQHPNMPPPMQQSVNTVPRESSEHAFGRAFYPCPTSDITLGSGGSETVSGLSSSQNDGDEHDYRDASIATDLDGVPPILHSDTNLPDPRDEMDEFDATLQRTNSLPGIRSLEDMEVASSACASDSSNAKSEKRRPIKRIAKGSDEQKENSNSGGSSRSAKSDISVPSSCG